MSGTLWANKPGAPFVPDCFMLWLRQIADQLFRGHHVGIDHVQSGQFTDVEFHGACCARVIDDDDVEALVSEAADGGRYTLVGKNAGANNVGDAHIGQQKPEIRARQRTVCGLGDNDLAVLGGNLRKYLRSLLILRKQKIVPSRLLLAERTIPAIGAQTSNSREKHVEAECAKPFQETPGIGDDGVMHALVKRRPSVIADKMITRERVGSWAIEIRVLHVDDEKRHLALFKRRIVGFRSALIVEGTAVGFPVHRGVLMYPPDDGGPA
ncbi:hypothetical protein AGR2A_Lc90082 [Agrobacterium genomosp. 2 str. CFBP 5494]|uniref:Uncharacterized protein n=1 Tax=Agrobacterium genomosp. 2 str. CFBP 5494 TaxID=1183436 RepID=A0A9W5B6F4_9HYPH|nr:hypothetical protein AGR2A_Lc90082 [Agrobacterium genomosp. 2 str. CFBP 5494]